MTAPFLSLRRLKFHLRVTSHRHAHFQDLVVDLKTIHLPNRILRVGRFIVAHKTESLAPASLFVNEHLC